MNTVYRVAMTPKSHSAIEEASIFNDESRTNVINRAVQLYLLVTTLFRNGCKIEVIHPDGRRNRITID